MILRPLPIILAVLLALCAEICALITTCSVPRIANGNGALRARGKMVRFRCNSEFELFGPRFVECVRGKWDQPLPMCLKAGCPPLTHPNGVLTLSESRTHVTLNCHANFVVAGAQTAYCDGTNWDRALGSCREVQIGPATWCDFEVDACDWTADTLNNYDWRRHNGISSGPGAMPQSSLLHSLLQRTGPQHDHTIGRPLEGHFMLAQAGDMRQYESARLISPLYTAEQGTDACFRLWYHMYGRQVSRLRVYVRPQGTDVLEMILEDRYMLFEKRGNQKNMWHEELIALDQQTQEFQIVIEAVAGESRLSDIAVDDVALLQGADCRNEQETIAEQTTPAAEEAGGVFDVASCAGRCGQSGELGTNSSDSSGMVLMCDCATSCMDTRTCCLDYLRICVFIEMFPETENETSTSSSTTTTTVKPTTIPSTSTTTTKPTRKPTTTPSTTSTTTTTTPKPTTTPSTTSTTTTRKPSTTPSTTSTTTTRKPITTMPTTPKPPIPVTITTKTVPKPLQDYSETELRKSTTVTDNAIIAVEIVSTPTLSIQKSKIVQWQPPVDIATTTETHSHWFVWTMVLCSAAAIIAIAFVIKLNGVHLMQALLPGRPSGRKHCSEVRFLIEDDGQLDFEEPAKKTKSLSSMQCENQL